MSTIGYNETTDLTAYALARNVTLNETASVLLTKALDYIEIQKFKGAKTDPAQELQFPRNGETEVPEQIKKAQLVCAMIYNAGDDPLGAVGPRVLREKVDVVEIQYSDKGNQSTYFPFLNALLAEFLEAKSGVNFAVRRA